MPRPTNLANLRVGVFSLPTNVATALSCKLPAAFRAVPLWSRMLRGQQAYGSIPLGLGQRLTVLGALACEGHVALMSIEAATSAPLLLA
jgi:hypothetical protein